jgi:hypothetical protein
MTPAKYLLLTGLIISSLFIFPACGNDEPNNPEETVPASLTISSNQAILFNDSNESFVFTVTGDDGLDYTASSEFYVNNALQFDNTFRANTEGMYAVYAKYKTRQSNTINVEVIDRGIQLTDITIASNTYEIVEESGDAFVFSVTGTKTDGESIDLSDLEGIKYYVNNTLIEGKTFTPTEVNEYSVYATFNDTITSNSLTVTCLPNPAIYVHKVLVEDFTGAWCGYCTRVLNGIEQVHAQTDKVLVAAIHRGSASGSDYDPFNLPEGMLLERQLGVTGYPCAWLNRATVWTYPENTHISQPINMLKAGSAYGIGIASTMGAASGTVTATIHFNAALPNAKCVVYVLEDNLICDQYNYLPNLYGGQNPIPNFNHKDVVRTVASNILGDAIPANQSGEGSTYTAQFTASYTSLDINNLRIMVVLLDSNGHVANVQVAPANTTQEYEMK